jgi:ubiquinone/menaquinone biosynthesis C-methylase UbiE
MGIRNLGAIINDRLRHQFIYNTFKHYGQRDELLDLGCGVKPFKEIYSAFARRHVGIDVETSPHPKSQVDQIYDGKRIPFENERFDYVLCTEVMEHVAEPVAFLHEINRVMKPGGVLVMTTPFMVSLHEEPYDFYRYTEHGIRYLLRLTGFKLTHLESFSGYIGVMIALLVKPQLRIWNKISKLFRLQWLYSEWNPFITVGVVMPQYGYLWLYRILRKVKLKKQTSTTPRGYGFTAIKI